MLSGETGNNSSGANSSSVELVQSVVESGRGFARGPIRALMSALLFDGVQNCLSYAFTESAGTKKRCKESFKWVQHQGSDYIFSFDSVCEALGIDPDFLRGGLLEAANGNSSEWKRGRRHF